MTAWKVYLSISFFALSYLSRHDAELERLSQLQAGRGRLTDHYHQQYARREDAVRLTIAREREEFETSGIGELVRAISEACCCRTQSLQKFPTSPVRKP